MAISVREAALRLDSSSRRVLQLIQAGTIPAEKISGVYVIDESLLPRRRFRGRAMSKRMAWGFISLLSGTDNPVLGATERYRLRQHLHQLLNDDDPSGLLMTWVRNRAERLCFNVQNVALENLRNDPRLVLSGVSDQRSGLSAAHQVEGYVSQDHLSSIIADYLLVPASPSNVVLHVVDEPHQFPAPAPVRVGLVMADLADYCMAREDARVKEMMMEVHL